MDLETVIKDIEEEQLFTRGITSKIFKSMLNQPSLVSVNSANAVKIESENGYYTFKIDFPRPILDVDTIQLLTTSIPQANASIPNTAIVFWYYRLSEYTGTTPSLNNLYCVRLLPSYYKPEFIVNPTNYGWNKTFNSYQKLSDELAKSCTTDLGYYNLENYLKPLTDGAYDSFQFPFLPGDITIAYNSTYNKFQMTGNTTALAYIQWSSATTYAINAVVFLGTETYTSLQNSNLNQNPTSSPLWWKLTQNEIVASWSSTTVYGPYNLVRFNGVLYRTLQTTIGISPTDPLTPWVAYTPDIPYRYLITGYDDPNVAKMQGELFQLPYEPTHFYQTGESVFTDGRVFRALTQTSVLTPGNLFRTATAQRIVYYQGTYRRHPFPVWDQTITYPVGSTVVSNNISYVSIENVDPNVNNVPASFPDFWQPIQTPPIQNWIILTPNPTNLPIWSQFQAYKVGDLVYDESDCLICIQANTGVSTVNNAYWRLNMFHPYDARSVGDYGGIKPANTVATYNGLFYVANIDTNNIPPNADWTAIGRIAWDNYNYDSSIVYDPEDQVYFNGQYYERNETTLNVYPPVPEWNPRTFYPANTFIQNEGLVFRCRVPNQGRAPADVANTWSAGTIYEVGQIVGLNNKQYICKIKHLNLNPENPVPGWSNATAYLQWNIAFLAGVQTYRCTNPVGPSALSPNNDPGNWQGVFGSDNITNVWELTGDWEELGESNWDEIEDIPADETGLFGLSEECDFLEHDGAGELLSDQFPKGIPPQPFNPNPERLLNSILGFTWNGVFDPTLLTNITGTISAKDITLYNRLRPVPYYEIPPAPPLLEDNPPKTATITRTYTAEGYANLVYSSIVNIYTNVIGGSTLDTVRNTNLVATTSMNCGNLGIAFHGNYIDTPLQRVAGDINELTIELRDEVGEPFFLTNNAIMTATFKITYKDAGVRIEEPA
jgi:chitodextrinase